MIGKSALHVGKMDVILTDSHFDTRRQICIPINVIAPKLEYAGEVWEGNANSSTAANSTYDSKLQGLRTGVGDFG